MMRSVIDSLVYLMIILSSGAIIQLLRDGGARDQGMIIEYSGPLDYLPVFWKILAIFTISFVFFKTKNRYFQLDWLWMGIILLCFTSAIWASYPAAVFTSSFMLLLAYLLVNLHVYLFGHQRVLETLNRVFITILGLSLLAVFLLPSYGISVDGHNGKWQGVFVHKNSLGNFSALMFVFYIWWYSIKPQPIKLGGAVLSIILVFGSGSSTSLAVIGVSIFLFGLLRLEYIKKFLFTSRNLFLFFIVALVILAMYTALSGNEFELQDKSSSFSDRNLVWMFFLQEINIAPWLGHGLDQFAVVSSLDESYVVWGVGFFVGTAHNGYLESLYALGTVGFGLIFIVIWKLLYRTNNGPEFDLALLFITSFAIINTMESHLLGFNVYFIMLMYISTLCKPEPIKFKQSRILLSQHLIKK